MSLLARLLYKVNKALFIKARNPLRSHGPDHHWRVYQNALKLAKKLRVRFDGEVLAAACLLHDLAAYYSEKTGERYHEFDHKLAQKVLKSIRFPNDKIPLVLEAIAHHGSDPKYKQNRESIETTLLRDADKMDVFGPLGVARIIMVRTLKGDTLQQIVKDFYIDGHLKRKWDSITTKEAKAMCRKDHQYSLEFFRKLSRIR